MMSEVSFNSTLDVATPLVKSRRISILPISHADLSSPTTARKQLQLLELDNVALSNELTEREEQVSALEAELDTLRSKLASSSATTMLTSSTSTDSINGDTHQRSSAQVKAAKRLLHRLIAQIASYDSEPADEDKLFNLDQSLVYDPERSIVAPSSTHLTTPNGKTSVVRRFEGDLLDDVEILGSVLKEYARKTTFAADEQSVALQSAISRNEALETRIKQLEGELEQAKAAVDEESGKDRLVDELRADLSATQQRESDLKTKLETSQSQLSAVQAELKQALGRLDQITAEQELTISAAAKKSAAQIEALQLQLEEQQQQQQHESPTCSCNPTTSSADESTSSDPSRAIQLETQLAQLQHERDLAAQESSAKIASLEAQLDERRTKASDLQSIFAELQEKKQKLHAIQLHTTHIRSLEKVLVQQQRIVDLLDRRPSAQDGEEWMAYAQQLSASLAQLKTGATDSRTERSDAAVMTDVETSIGMKEVVDDELVLGLKEKIEELEARILRRNEQIGSLQRQLHNVENDLARTRTNRMLAEETVAELDAEKSELQTQVTSLQEQIVQLEHSPASPSQEQRVEASSQTTLESAPEIELALSSAKQRITSLEAQLTHLSASQTDREALQRTITTLTSQIHHLESSLTTAHQSTHSLQQHHDHDLELTTLQTTLHKTQDRLTTTQHQLSALQLCLAEARESSASASADAERIVTLEAQLLEAQRQREALVASSNADAKAVEELRVVVAELRSKMEGLESGAVSREEELVEARRVLEVELVEAREKVKGLEEVLEEREGALRTRNAEYWTLKEELAELQEEAERSHHNVDAPALTELQTQLAASLSAKSTLEQRITSQESALLKLKSDLAAARSTEDLLNQQYQSSQRRITDLESTISHLESHPPSTASTAQLEVLQTKLTHTQSELDYLTNRIQELESELGRKADEIEEADSKILDALKESKKYATRYSKLSARYEALQRESEGRVEQLSATKVELEKERERVKVLMRGKSDAEGGMVKNGGGLAGRKRAKPDSVEEEEVKVDEGVKTPSGARGVKAVYAPSPSNGGRTPTSFTPVRRSAKSSSRIKPAPSNSHTPVVLGHGTPAATTTTETEAGMTRSTSNPSALIATRLLQASTTSPVKPTLLSDKTNIVASTAGTSRLSSKIATASAEGKPNRVVTSLLPQETAARGEVARKRGDERKVLGSSAATVVRSGGGGAADFLARMKAQRAAATAAAAGGGGGGGQRA
ncbi:putative protein [Sporisorium scitamineum]|uniref:Uncharacterized protein n=1 Tax=Sporisorium scitamineum TaxID=49012 RepID=A0A127Z859_9BASI|nr:putative protein [Sporisorium scitamineum]